MEYKYLYIFEDGTIKQSFNPPTKDDFESVRNGVLIVIKFDDFYGEFCEVYDDGQIPVDKIS